MDTTVEIFRDGIGVLLKTAGPMLLMSMAIGVFIAIFQAVTQIHEQTLAFIFKLIVVVVYLSVGGSWMLRMLQDYALELYALM